MAAARLDPHVGDLDPESPVGRAFGRTAAVGRQTALNFAPRLGAKRLALDKNRWLKLECTASNGGSPGGGGGFGRPVLGKTEPDSKGRNLDGRRPWNESPSSNE